MQFLASFVLAFVVAGIYLTLGADITAELQSDYESEQGNYSGPYNVTSDTLDGIDEVAGRMDLIGLAVGVVLVISYLKMVK